MTTKTRKQFTKEFKFDALRLVTKQGCRRSEVARRQGLDSGVLGRWVYEYGDGEQEAFRGNGQTTEEQAKLRCLHDENRCLKMEREILKTSPLNIHGASKIEGELAIRESGCRRLQCPRPRCAPSGVPGDGRRDFPQPGKENAVLFDMKSVLEQTPADPKAIA